MTTKDRLPIFREYELDELAELTGYTTRYCLDIREGDKPVGRRFRIVASKVLRRPIEELFGPQGDDRVETGNA